MTLLVVALAGGLGAAARFVVDGIVRSRWAGGFPFGTVTVNVSGSLLVGLIAGAALFGGLGSTALAVGATGFCGGYTTFSTAMVDTVRLAQAGELGHAALNVVGTSVLAVAAAALGMAVAATLA